MLSTLLPPDRVLDCCGSAECFTAWAGLSLINGQSSQEAAEMGARAMKHSLSRAGGHSGMPYRGEILASLAPVKSQAYKIPEYEPGFRDRRTGPPDRRMPQRPSKKAISPLANLAKNIFRIKPS